MDQIHFRQATLQDDAISANHLIKIAQELGVSEVELDPKFLTIAIRFEL